VKNQFYLSPNILFQNEQRKKMEGKLANPGGLPGKRLLNGEGEEGVI